MTSSPAPAIHISTKCREHGPLSLHSSATRILSSPGSPGSALGPPSWPESPAEPPAHFALRQADATWAFNNNPNWHGFGAMHMMVPTRQSITNGQEVQEMDPARKPNVPLFGPQPRSGDIADSSGSITPNEEGNRDNTPNYKLQSERQLGQRSLDTSAHAYDRGLLSKIGGPNTPGRVPSVASLTGDTSVQSPMEQDGRPSILKRLSIPERRRSSNDARLYRNSSTTGVPSQPSFRSSSIFEVPPDSLHRMSMKRNSSFGLDERSPMRASHDSAISQGGSLRDLRIYDKSPGTSDDWSDGSRLGMKRRASSPRREESGRASLSSITSLHDANGRHPYLQPTESPIQRYGNAHHSSVSSASSLGPRTASLSSSHKLSIASSATSYTGSGHLSPNLLSPTTELEACSPFSALRSLDPSPRSAMPQHPAGSRLSVDLGNQFGNLPVNPDAMRRPSGVTGLLICDCCPKKPRKFTTEQDLRLHHMEKQYTCLYCPNRFKNKNEAERHQNSLHLRRHSWSCAALPSIEDAFHPGHFPGNESSPAEMDVCGYCGAEFPNFPRPDWEKRKYHLLAEHKFGECNQAKKFFRTDHFRQHLKHSHAGTSGKWTNVLENACMKEEPAPPILVRPEYSMAMSTGSYVQQIGNHRADRIDEER